MNGYFFFGALNCLLSVALGAFGAHKLRGHLTAEAMHSFEVSVNYQISQGIAIIILAIATQVWGQNKWLFASATTLCIGVTLFCGSLYILTLTDIRRPFGFPIGLVTPLGGLFLLGGWTLALVAAFNLSRP